MILNTIFEQGIETTSQRENNFNIKKSICHTFREAEIIIDIAI